MIHFQRNVHSIFNNRFTISQLHNQRVVSGNTSLSYKLITLTETTKDMQKYKITYGA